MQPTSNPKPNPKSIHGPLLIEVHIYSYLILYFYLFIYLFRTPFDLNLNIDSKRIWTLCDNKNKSIRDKFICIRRHYHTYKTISFFKFISIFSTNYIKCFRFCRVYESKSWKCLFSFFLSFFFFFFLFLCYFFFKEIK